MIFQDFPAHDRVAQEGEEVQLDRVVQEKFPGVEEKIDHSPSADPARHSTGFCRILRRVPTRVGMCSHARWESSGICFPLAQTPRAELSHPRFGVCSRSACP
jgi:hypothetical protein